MAMQLLKQSLYKLVLVSAFYSCSDKNSIEGDWGAIDRNGNYSELYIAQNQIHIYDEAGGQISPQNYYLTKDSLCTMVLQYRMKWVNQNSVELSSKLFSLQLMRITHGVRLSRSLDKLDENGFLKDFYKRMKQRKEEVEVNPPNLKK